MSQPEDDEYEGDEAMRDHDEDLRKFEEDTLDEEDH